MHIVMGAGGPGYSHTITGTMPTLIETGAPAEFAEQFMIANAWCLLAGDACPDATGANR